MKAKPICKMHKNMTNKEQGKEMAHNETNKSLECIAPAKVTLLHITPDDIVFDIGSNKGDYTIPVQKRAKHIYAFEPNTEISKSMNVDGMQNVTVINSAISDFEGDATLFIDDRPGQWAQASSLKKVVHEARPITVPVTTVDIFCAGNNVYPTFIKIDVEGFEPQVIKGARSVIETRRPIILFEIWEKNWMGYSDMIQYLSKFYFLVRSSDGSDAIEYYTNNEEASGVDDILCLPRKP